MTSLLSKVILSVFIFALLFSVFSFVFAQEDQIEINFFYSRTCPHCAKEEKFLDEIESQYPEIKINRFETSKKENLDLLIKLYNDYNVPLEERGLVPITFVEGRFFSGFNDEIGEEIETCILGKIENNSHQDCQCQECSSEESTKISLPFLGKIDMSNYSLPVLSVVLGALDGFNVCSLGVLVLILGLVLALKSRKRVLIFGGIFILTTAIVYGFLIVLWYQVFSFFSQYLKIMEILIGLLALGGGVYFFKEFLKFRKYGLTCDTGGGKKLISKFSSKFQQSVGESKNIFLIVGLVLIFAAIITIVEFPCSAAVPVVFAGVLANAQLSTFSYLFYIVLFLIFYMLDEIIVFLVAFLTMKIWLASSKVITWITLIEALILFALGLYYLFGFGILL